MDTRIEVGHSAAREFYRPSMMAALEVAEKCRNIEWYGVGCVITDLKGKVIASGYTGEEVDVDGGFKHAEEVALEKALRSPGKNEAGRWILFSTLEPCSVRASGKLSCVGRIVAAQIQEVVFGAKEPYDPRLGIVCEGAQQLQRAGVKTLWLKEFEQACLKSIVSKRKDSC